MLVTSCAQCFFAALAAFGPEWVHNLPHGENAQQQQLRELQFAINIAELMNELLERHPLWNSSPNPSPVTDSATTEPTIPRHHPAISSPLPLCLTPNLDHWRSNQERIALRILTTLIWLHGGEVAQQQHRSISYRNAHIILREDLAMLLNRLLLGHLLDLHLDMTKIIRVGMASVAQLAVQIPDYRPITDLFAAFALRLNYDNRIYHSQDNNSLDAKTHLDEEAISHLCTLFCKSTTSV